jgi:hypothetical protein
MSPIGAVFFSKQIAPGLEQTCPEATPYAVESAITRRERDWETQFNGRRRRAVSSPVRGERERRTRQERERDDGKLAEEGRTSFRARGMVPRLEPRELTQRFPSDWKPLGLHIFYSSHVSKSFRNWVISLFRMDESNLYITKCLPRSWFEGSCDYLIRRLEHQVNASVDHFEPPN